MYNKESQQITAPVTINDVQRALGLGANNLQSLCTSDRINIFSRHKPVADNFIYAQDIDSAKSNYNPNWYRGFSNNCGIIIPSVTESYSYNYKQLKRWGKEEITPESKQPYRLSDFAGYVHIPRYTEINGCKDIIKVSFPSVMYIDGDRIPPTADVHANICVNGGESHLGLLDFINARTTPALYLFVQLINTRTGNTALVRHSTNILAANIDPDGVVKKDTYKELDLILSLNATLASNFYAAGDSITAVAFLSTATSERFDRAFCLSLNISERNNALAEIACLEVKKTDSFSASLILTRTGSPAGAAGLTCGNYDLELILNAQNKNGGNVSNLRIEFLRYKGDVHTYASVDNVYAVAAGQTVKYKILSDIVLEEESIQTHSWNGSVRITDTVGKLLAYKEIGVRPY